VTRRLWYLAAMSNFLPADWKESLKQVAEWLDAAGRAADQRERAFAERFPPASGSSRSEPDTSRLRELTARMRALESAAGEADEFALAEETQLRERVERSESLRLRLAERVGKAA
jgi:hypothetical protein